MRPRALLFAVLIAACGSTTGVDTTSTQPGIDTSLPAATSTVAPGTTTAPPVAGCPTDPSFVDRGRVLRLDQPTTDTNSLGLISWQVDDGCERFGIDFETTEGAPATTPPTVIVDFLETRQILRIWMDLGSTIITDQVVETPLVDRLFVVRALDGGMFLDLHLVGPARARVAITNSPARMSVELQTAEEPFVVAPAVISEQVVVVTPSIGTETVPAVDVTGYARTSEGNVLMQASVAGDVMAETVVTAADSAATWGEFRAPLILPAGQVDLFVGEPGADEGEPTGVTLTLTVR
jgi:hypothetical protein